MILTAERPPVCFASDRPSYSASSRALLLGLSFEPENAELNAFRQEIETKIAAEEAKEWAALTGQVEVKGEEKVEEKVVDLESTD